MERNEATEEIVCCAYCLHDVPGTEDDVPPAADDDEAWAELARYHSQGCEWVETRAHRINVD